MRISLDRDVENDYPYNGAFNLSGFSNADAVTSLSGDCSFHTSESHKSYSVRLNAAHGLDPKSYDQPIKLNLMFNGDAFLAGGIINVFGRPYFS